VLLSVARQQHRHSAMDEETGDRTQERLVFLAGRLRGDGVGVRRELVGRSLIFQMIDIHYQDL
jgi:hypothetical protein